MNAIPPTVNNRAGQDRPEPMQGVPMHLTRRLLTAAVALLTLPLFWQTTKQRGVGPDHKVKLDLETRPGGALFPPYRAPETTGILSACPKHSTSDAC
jgi:hypothetical protein